MPFLQFTTNHIAHINVADGESLLAPSKRVLIIPDGPLFGLPFGALMRNEKEYLIEWKPLHTAISATVYAELRKSRKEADSVAVQLVAFGDPLYPTVDTAKP